MNVRLIDVQELGPFSYGWPDGIEQFTSGWQGHAESAEGRVRFRYGIGERIVYGRPRRHSVVWLAGAPVAEGVASDDHAISRCLVSRVKGSDRKVVRDADRLPTGIEGFTIVEHRDEIDAPYSPRCLAVKLPEDDVAGWVSFALTRIRAGGETPKKAEGRVRSKVPPVAEARARRTSLREAFEPIDDQVQLAVARELVAFEERTNGPLQRGIVRLTLDDEADRFVHQDDFGFLLAVIFDQGVPYGRAWRAPLRLRERLGHLDPVRIAAEPDAVAAAIAARPALHRYVNKMPQWVVLAAQKVLEGYEGDAGAIWRGRSAAEVRDRLDDFVGISQKKAAMTVMLLWRCRGEDISGMEDCDVAIDVHLRRVFLRTGLATHDDSRTMIEAARRLYPALPGALDPPAWVIGQQWCRPRDPLCHACALGSVCARLVSRAAGVVGS
jgi:uncharacterized HhH-GPD family protein